MPGSRWQLLTLCLLSCAGGAVWFALDRPPPPATWLSVTAPASAVAGEVLPVDVILRETMARPDGSPLAVVVDLHWTTAWREDRRYLATAPAQPAAPVGSVMRFPVVIPQREDLGFVHALIYVSPDGRWGHRIHAARTADIPVQTSGTPPPDPTPRDLRPANIMNDPGGNPSRSLPIRLLLATGWVICAVLWQRRFATPDSRRPLLMYAALIAAAWELSFLDVVLGEHARAWARHLHWYELRGPLQQVLTVGIVVATTAVCLWIWQDKTGAARRRARLGLLLYAGVSLASFLSLHRIDVLLSHQLLSWSLLQIIQLVAVAVALTAGWHRRIRPATT